MIFSIADYSIPLYGYIAPFFMLITLIANTLIIIVLSKKNMINQTNMILLAMAICDLLTIVFPGKFFSFTFSELQLMKSFSCSAPGFFYMYTFGQHYKPMGPVNFCYLWTLFNETLPAMFHTASIWLTLALAAQR